MPTLADATAEFLAQRRIAVAGVSREAGHGGNFIYQRLRARGYEVFAVNPNADVVEGDRCYRDLASIPGGIDAVVIATGAADTPAVVADCAKLGVRRVWMHHGVGPGSVSAEAVQAGRASGMTVIAGGCPLMFGPTADIGHRCIRWLQALTGGAPKAG